MLPAQPFSLQRTSVSHGSAQTNAFQPFTSQHNSDAANCATFPTTSEPQPEQQERQLLACKPLAAFPDAGLALGADPDFEEFLMLNDMRAEDVDNAPVDTPADTPVDTPAKVPSAGGSRAVAAAAKAKRNNQQSAAAAQPALTYQPAPSDTAFEMEPKAKATKMATEQAGDDAEWKPGASSADTAPDGWRKRRRKSSGGEDARRARRCGLCLLLRPHSNCILAHELSGIVLEASRCALQLLHHCCALQLQWRLLHCAHALSELPCCTGGTDDMRAGASQTATARAGAACARWKRSSTSRGASASCRAWRTRARRSCAARAASARKRRRACATWSFATRPQCSRCASLELAILSGRIENVHAARACAVSFSGRSVLASAQHVAAQFCAIGFWAEHLNVTALQVDNLCNELAGCPVPLSAALRAALGELRSMQ
jgi:hypothetical protein